MKRFCFTVDDNIRFLKEINEGGYGSIFDHPYLAMYKALHRRFGVKIQLNLFYRLEDFELSQMTSEYIEQWRESADWLKMSFHSELENVRPYEFSGYEEVYGHCDQVNGQIIRFASPEALAKTTTVHYCLATDSGLKALSDNGVKGLLGLFGTEENPITSYGLNEYEAKRIREGNVIESREIKFASIDIVLNRFTKEEILEKLEALSERKEIRVMIHEQYFYPDYKKYQPDFEEKLAATLEFFEARGYQSRFFEEMIQ